MGQYDFPTVFWAGPPDQGRAEDIGAVFYLVTPDLLDTDAAGPPWRQLLPGAPGDRAIPQQARRCGLKREQSTTPAGLCRAAGVPLVINDSLALALEIGADGATWAATTAIPRPRPRGPSARGASSA